MQKFIYILVSLVCALALAKQARAQESYTYYVDNNTNMHVCAMQAPFGEVYVVHSGPMSPQLCQEHYHYFLQNYPSKYVFRNNVYYIHWDDRITYNTYYLNVLRLPTYRVRTYYSPPRTNYRVHSTHRHTTTRHFYVPPVRPYMPPREVAPPVRTYGSTRRALPPQERRVVRSETTTRRRTVSSSNNDNRRRDRSSERRRRR